MFCLPLRPAPIGFLLCLFFFNDTATTEIYTLSLHDALPILWLSNLMLAGADIDTETDRLDRSEEHTSELQSPCNLVCRLLLEKKTKYKTHGRCALLTHTLRAMLATIR